MPGADTDHDVGRILGERYRLEQRIGVGASAVVYRATDLNLRRSVAVKQVKPELSGDGRFLKLFRSEAHLAGQLDHPNVLTIHDWSADEDGRDGGAYIVTEHLTGGTLRQLLDREGPLPVDDVARIGLQVAQGLRAAHAAGLVHRDIKPGNLLFGADGRVRVVDFGIARAVAEAAWTEPEGHLIGTARYAAPEQAQSGEVNGRADVYSLAVCLTEMATGEVPLVGESALATMMLRRDVDLPPEPALGPLAELVAWAGMAEWAARPSADQLVTELAASQGITGLDPVTVIDLTSGPAPSGRASASGRIRSDRTGEPEGWEEVGRGDGTGSGQLDWSGQPTVDGSWPATDGAPGVHPGEVVALGDRTDDGYLTATGVEVGRRRSWRWLGLGVFLLAAVGAAAGGWYLAGIQDEPTEVIEVGLPSWPVPDFTGLTAADAAEVVADYRWTVSVEERNADGTTAGELLEQRPAAGELRGPGAGIELVYSLGPVERQVPDLVGRPEAEARQAITAARLAVGEVTQSDSEDVEVGLVIAATIGGSPAELGAEHPTGTEVDLVVSTGPAPRVVPELAGSTLDAARAALGELGLALGTAEDYSETVGEGRIISVSPAPGTEVARDSTVTVTVSLGLPLIEIPDLAGLPVLDAADQLSALGFTVRIEGAAEADVLGTRPQAGTSARLGASVTIVSTQE